MHSEHGMLFASAEMQIYYLFLKHQKKKKKKKKKNHATAQLILMEHNAVHAHLLCLFFIKHNGDGFCYTIIGERLLDVVLDGQNPV